MANHISSGSTTRRAYGAATSWLAFALVLAISATASANGEEAIWSPPAENSDGLRSTLLSSTPETNAANEIDRINVCFVLSNNSVPPTLLGSDDMFPAFAELRFEDAPTGFFYEFSNPTMIDAGAENVTCAIDGGDAALAIVTPNPGGLSSGEIAASTMTNQCCFDVAAPPVPPPVGGFALMSGSTDCDPNFTQCYPGSNGELLTRVCSDSGCTDITTEVFVWSLGGPGCGLVGIEVLLVPLAAGLRRGRALRRRGFA